MEYFKTNPHLRKLEFFRRDITLPNHGNELRFFLPLNHLGRRHVYPSDDVPVALWPTILARMTGSFDDRGALYYFLRRKAALVRARDGGVKRCSGGGEGNGSPCSKKAGFSYT